MWCAPKLDAPHATPRRPLRVSGTIQSRARRPPAPPPPPPPGEPSSAPQRSILWYMAGRPRRSSYHGRQSLGRREGRGRPGAGGRAAQGGLRGAASPSQSAHPLPPADSLLGVLESAAPCPPKNPKHSRGRCSRRGRLVPKGSPREQPARGGRLLPEFQGSRLSGETPKEFRARARARGWGAGRRWEAPPGGSSLLHASRPPPSR